MSEGKNEWALDLLERYAKKICVFLPCLAEMAVCSPRNQYSPLAEPLDTVEIQRCLHRLNLRISCGDFLWYINIPSRWVGQERVTVCDSCFDDSRGNIVSLERIP